MRSTEISSSHTHKIARRMITAETNKFYIVQRNPCRIPFDSHGLYRVNITIILANEKTLLSPQPAIILLIRRCVELIRQVAVL